MFQAREILAITPADVDHVVVESEEDEEVANKEGGGGHQKHHVSPPDSLHNRTSDKPSEEGSYAQESSWKKRKKAH